MSRDVVIPTWRGREMLERCLHALAADPSPHTVIVVDNASDDGTVERLRAAHPDVVLVALPENVGFGRAVNAGVAAGSGEHVVLINNDVLVEPGFVDAIAAPLERSAGVGMVAGLTLMPGDAGERVDAFGIELDPTLAAYNRGRHAEVGAPVGRLAAPSGGAAAYRRRAFEQVGGFDSALFAYGEDVDLGLRLHAAGWAAAQAPEARGVHLGGATVGVDSPWQRELAGFSRGFLLRRYGVLATRHAARALALEALVVGWGVARHRTLVPLRSRVRGWRAGGEAGPRRPYPAAAVDTAIDVRQAVERLRGPR